VVRDDWAAQATDTIEQVVGIARDRSVTPARNAGKAVVYGLLVAFFVATALVLLVIAFFRGVFIITGRVWGAYFIVGGILIIAGALCWVARSPRSDEPTS
jgi:hypothetical protein